jgi:hypothetical protein
MKTKLPTSIGEMEWALDRVAKVSCFDDETRAALRYANYILAITRNYVGYDTLADDATRNLEVALSKHCASELSQSNPT